MHHQRLRNAVGRMPTNPLPGCIRNRTGHYMMKTVSNIKSLPMAYFATNPRSLSDTHCVLASCNAISSGLIKYLKGDGLYQEGARVRRDLVLMLTCQAPIHTGSARSAFQRLQSSCPWYTRRAEGSLLVPRSSPSYWDPADRGRDISGTARCGTMQ